MIQGHCFPPEIIRRAVWLYARFALSYRDVEDLLAERGLDISYESVRRWFLKFGAPIARNLRHTRPIPNGYWHLDEMVIVIRGQRYWLWRGIAYKLQEKTRGGLSKATQRRLRALAKAFLVCGLQARAHRRRPRRRTMAERRKPPRVKSPATVRCAIYTRKSSEAGLEQDFNSLDAQREACEAYIASQKHEGWTALSNFYDDGGVSGGTLERPALQRLLDDIEEDLIDTIVVYKVDRLSRALSDFAKLVEIFDRHEISFVSVT